MERKSTLVANEDNAKIEFDNLVERAMAGEQQSISELSETIAKTVLWQSLNLLQCEQDAQDVTQEVLLKVWEKIDTLRDHKKFNAWLSKIIINAKNQFLRGKEKRKVLVDLDDYSGELEDHKEEFIPEAVIENEEMSKIVLSIVSTLPTRQREAIMLHYFGDLSVKETGEAMDVTPQCASQFLLLATKRLKRELEKLDISKESISTAAMVPVGAVLSAALRVESEIFFAANQAYLQSAIASSVQIASEVAVAEAVSGVWSAKDICIAAVAGIAITASVLVVGLQPRAEVQENPLPVLSAPLELTDTTVEFSGGYDPGDGVAYVNPQQVHLSKGSIERWQITDLDGEVMFSGEGENADEALAVMHSSGKQGEFYIEIWLREEPIMARRNFYNIS